MNSSVRPRPNYYELLGLTPTAVGDEIAKAFVREFSMFRPSTREVAAQVSLAYATLRDPGRRRAYDESLGLKPAAPAPRIHPVLGSLRPPPNQPRRAPAPAPLPEPRIRREPEPAIAPPRHALEEQLGVEARPIEWKRMGVVAGGLVVAAGLVGGLAGWWSGDDVAEPAGPKRAVALSLPPATVESPPPAPYPSVETARPEGRLATARPRVARSRPAAPPKPEPEPGPRIVEQAPADAPPVTSAATESMPLPNKVVARTIERIGYSCGAVASTAPVEGGAAGVYKVTCTSGQSYQAKPVNGRYRFKRLGRS
jgi:hypothetical protein